MGFGTRADPLYFQGSSLRTQLSIQIHSNDWISKSYRLATYVTIGGCELERDLVRAQRPDPQGRFNLSTHWGLENRCSGCIKCAKSSKESDGHTFRDDLRLELLRIPTRAGPSTSQFVEPSDYQELAIGAPVPSGIMIPVSIFPLVREKGWFLNVFNDLASVSGLRCTIHRTMKPQASIYSSHRPPLDRGTWVWFCVALKNWPRSF